MDAYQAFSTYVDRLLERGVYKTTEEAIYDLMKSHENRLLMTEDLRNTIEASIARGGSLTDADVAAQIDAEHDAAVAKGF